MAAVRHLDHHRRRRDDARAVERDFLDALERGDSASDLLVRKLLAVLRGERPERPETA
jgi:hypothetical protein